MSSVSSRELQDRTAEVLRTVADGAPVTITVDGVPVAEIRPIRPSRARFLAKADLVGIVSRQQADAGLTREVDDRYDDITDEVRAQVAPLSDSLHAEMRTAGWIRPATKSIRDLPAPEVGAPVSPTLETRRLDERY